MLNQMMKSVLEQDRAAIVKCVVKPLALAMGI